MNLVDKIALDCGVKVGKPYIDRLFMPLKNHDFIIFDTRSDATCVGVCDIIYAQTVGYN